MPISAPIAGRAGSKPMLYIDGRVGSRELIRYFAEGTATLTSLQFGDASFIGQGPEEAPVLVGIEVKTLSDMIQSMLNGRFSGHQLPGLLRDYHVVYLIIEGHYRPEPGTGFLQVPRGRGQWIMAPFGTKAWKFRDLEGFLTTIETQYGVRLRRSQNRQETGALIGELYHWWTDKMYAEHRSGQAFDTSHEPILYPTSLVRRVAAQLKGIGWKRSQAVAEHFSSVVDMVLAPAEEWRRITGVGPKLAASVVADLWRKKRAASPPNTDIGERPNDDL